MKYVLAFEVRQATHEADRVEEGERLMTLVQTFQPSSTILQWVHRIDCRGGFAVMETDDPVSLISDVAGMASFLEVTVYPVVDFVEALPAILRGQEFRASIQA
jgi:hypothetical protein